MIRQQFLSELSQFLTFLSAQEKSQVLSAYERRFDSAGPLEESTLISSLGTPMVVTINMRRSLDSGVTLEQLLEDIAGGTQKEVPSAQASLFDEPIITQEAQGAQAATPAEPAQSEVHFEPEALTVPQPSADEPEEAPAVPVEAVPVEAVPVEAVPVEAAPVEAARPPEIKTLPDDLTEEAPAQPSDPPRPEAIQAAPGSLPHAASPSTRQEQAPKKKKNIAAIIGSTLLSLIIALVCLAVVGLGVYGMAIMGNLVLTAMNNFYIMADALLLLAGGCAAGAIGLLLIWFGIWCAIRLISGLFKRALA